MSVIPRIVVFAGSTRSGAYSGKTAGAAVKMLAILGGEVTQLSLLDYPLPLMNEDLERDQGIPANVMRLAKIIDIHDGILIATPEYNASIPPLLKNTLDWLSRNLKDSSGRPLKPFDGKVAALCSSSTGAFGGMRALNHLRPVCMGIGLEVITPQCSVSNAKTAFDDNGELVNERTRATMERTCKTLLEHAKLLSRRI